MFHYSLTSVMSMGVMLFQVYMAVMVVWLAKIFESDVIKLQQRWLPRFTFVRTALGWLTPVQRPIETLMLVLAVLLGAYTGFFAVGAEILPDAKQPDLTGAVFVLGDFFRRGGGVAGDVPRPA
ncbi:cytochrome c-type biogenesis protein [Atlantibacter hermannii]|nr:cytochrome c-type biogenesis protein [Atlantibacter hermannii]